MTTTTHAPPDQGTITRLQRAVNNIDCASQQGLSQIASIASLAIHHIQHGSESAAQMEHLANALRVIQDKALEVENCINSEAERVGCHYEEDSSNIGQHNTTGRM